MYKEGKVIFKILATFSIYYNIYLMSNKENRKLSTILAMDVVGYSSKMADDDEGTLQLLAERRLIIEKHTKSYGKTLENRRTDYRRVDFIR